MYTTLKLNKRFTLVAITSVENELLNSRSGEAQWLAKWAEGTKVIFNDSLKNVYEFFKVNDTLKLNGKTYKLIEFIEKVGEGFKKYDFVAEKEKYNKDWCLEVLRCNEGVNPAQTYELAEREFYSRPEVIEAYQKRYTIKALCGTPLESLISGLNYIGRTSGWFVLIENR